MGLVPIGKTKWAIRPCGRACCKPIRGMNDDLYKATCKPSEVKEVKVKKPKTAVKRGGNPSVTTKPTTTKTLQHVCGYVASVYHCYGGCNELMTTKTLQLTVTLLYLKKKH
ncbi:hypothetical protein DRO59_06690 [Candidatus Bathyarchaeota archaeon]|nr:MAG: hypothetical protein DRO59_06690 [Candidatus Bathyarchaeota archaeon]